MQNKLISSFGRRKARKLRETSQHAYDELLPLVKLELPENCHAEPLVPAKAGIISASKKIPKHPREGGDQDDNLGSQNNPSEIWLEIGFGGGEHMLSQLAQNPSISMVGCEPFMNGVAKLLTHLSPEDYPRVRIWHEDVRYLLDHISSSYFSRAFILFPDPWPKKRHRPRRLITTDFMAKLIPTLKEGALLHVASDDPSYVEQIQDVLYHHSSLKLCEGPLSADPSTWNSRPEGWPATRYEQKALNQGKKCAYMVFEKI